MKTILAVLIVVAAIASTADVSNAGRSAPRQVTKRERHCPPTCQHRKRPAAPCPEPAPCVKLVQEPEIPSNTVWQELVSGLELTAGFRWQREHECPTLLVPVPPEPRVVDPFYLGVGVSLPLSKNFRLFGEFNRDWTEAPNFDVRVGGKVRPWAR